MLQNNKLVDLSHYDGFVIDLQYPKLGMKFAYNKCLLRLGCLDKLISAGEDLKKDGYKLCIWDAWRPLDLQQELYLKFKDNILKSYRMLDASEEDKDKLVSQFVSKPDGSNLLRPPYHTTGGAIDLTLVTLDGEPVMMGTEFDDFSDLAKTFAFDGKYNVYSRNRHILYDAMTKNGFVNLESEWWHYSYGDCLWSDITGYAPLYFGIFSKEAAEASIL